MRKRFIYVLAKENLYTLSNNEIRKLNMYRSVKEVLCFDKYDYNNSINELKAMEYTEVDFKQFCNYI